MSGETNTGVSGSEFWPLDGREDTGMLEGFDAGNELSQCGGELVVSNVELSFTLWGCLSSLSWTFPISAHSADNVNAWFWTTGVFSTDVSHTVLFESLQLEEHSGTLGPWSAWFMFISSSLTLTLPDLSISSLSFTHCSLWPSCCETVTMSCSADPLSDLLSCCVPSICCVPISVCCVLSDCCVPTVCCAGLSPSAAGVKITASRLFKLSLSPVLQAVYRLFFRWYFSSSETHGEVYLYEVVTAIKSQEKSFIEKLCRLIVELSSRKIIF